MADFRFHGRVAAANRNYTNWDRALPVSVVADTKAEATQKIHDMMGAAPSGCYWTITFDKVEEELHA